MSYYNNNWKYRKKRNIGSTIALQHIEEAKKFSSEMGNIDQDVKDYFFSLKANQLDSILKQYGDEYGESAKSYAKETIQKWKTKKVQMSGMVAERLFKFLPPLMPLSYKFQIIENLWKHVGPSSQKVFYVNPNTSLDEIEKKIKEYCEKIIINYKIPDILEHRFNWLSQGDVLLKQQLLNFFIQQERLIAETTLNTHLPLLIEYQKEQKANYVNNVSHTLKIGKHEIKIVLTLDVENITELSPIKHSFGENKIEWFVIIFFAIMFFLYIKK